MRMLSGVGLILLLSACASKGSYERGRTVGHVPCAASEIKVLSEYENDSSGNVRMWQVSCRGVRYQCAQPLMSATSLVLLGTVATAASVQPMSCSPF